MDGLTRPFIGRRYELERVRRAIEQRARLVVVEGDAGMGKTRLLHESLSTVPATVPRFEGSAEPFDARLLGPIRDALAPEVIGWSRMPDTLRRHRAAIDALFPEGCERTTEVVEAPPGPALAESILAILQHSVGARHALLVVDDLQWADSDVLAVLNRILRSRLPCTTVVATRPLDEESEYLLQFFADLRRTVDVEHLELAPLTVAEVSDLLRRTVGMAATSFAVDVHERTGGHPFLIRQLLDTGQLSATADTFDLPRTVTEATRRALLHLSNDARIAVDAAAILGRTSTFGQLARFTAFDEPRLLAALQELCDERLLTEPTSDAFAFAHVLVQQAVNESIVSRHRRRLHTRALEVLPADADPLDVVHHAELAGTPEVGVAAVREAASRAMAAGHMGRAFRLASAGAALAPHDHELAQVRATSAWHTGRRADARQVANSVLESVADGDVRTRVRMEWLVARVAVELGELGEYNAAVDELIGMVDAVAEDDRADLLARIAETTMLSSRHDAVEWGERACAATVPGSGAHSVALINLGSALTDMPGRRDEGRRALRTAVELTRHAGGDFARARALNNLLSEIVYVDSGPEVLALLDEFEEHILASGLAPQFGDNAVLWRGVVAERLGDLAAARAALSWFGPAAPERSSCLLSFGALLELSAGDLEGCGRELEREPSARPGYLNTFRMIDLERAVRCGERTVADASEELFTTHGVRSRYMLDHIDQVGRAAVVLARFGSRDGAALVSDIANRWASLMVDDPDGGRVHEHLSAIAAESSGRHAHAIELYERSLSGLPRRAATISADAHQALARCWDACGDRKVARTWASSAVRLLDKWPGPDRDASTRLLRNLGGRPPRSDTVSALSDREREVADLVGRGLTNKEIGASLFISDRTVGVHIQHIMTKLDLGKRAEIAAYVARGGAS